MPGSNNESLVNTAKLISQNFTDIERRFAVNLRDKLEERISERIGIARGGDVSAVINIKKSLGIKLGSHLSEGATSAGANAIGSGIGASLTSMAITGVAIAGGATVAITLGIGAVTAVVGGFVSYGVVKVLEAKPKKKVKKKAKIYKDYFPRNNNTIKLFSQLITLAMANELQAIPSEKAVKKLINKSFAEIWDIFKKFTRNPEEYGYFREMPFAKKIVNLFANYCDLGDPTDRSEMVNEKDINVLWINLFACYVEEKDPEMFQSVLSILESKFNISMHRLPSIYEERANALEARTSLDSIQSSTSLSLQCSSSSGIGTGDLAVSLNESFSSSSSFVSCYSSMGNASSQFFSKKTDSLVINSLEQEEGLIYRMCL